MKYFLYLSFIALVFFAGCKGQDQPVMSATVAEVPDTDSLDRAAIQGILMEYQLALNTSDAAKATSLYTTDGVFMPTGAPSATGTEAILASYTQIFSMIQLSIEFSIDEVVINEFMAYALTGSKGTVLIRQLGESLPEENRELFVFEKQDGQWKIARYMFNKMAMPA